MAAPNRYRGGLGLYIKWTTTTGTVTLHDDYTAWDVSQDIDLPEVTAGNEADATFIAGIAKGTGKLTYYDTGLSGTSVANQLQKGQYGTIEYAPQGTATGKPKRQFAAWVSKFDEKYPQPGAVEFSAEFTKHGAMITTPTSVY